MTREILFFEKDHTYLVDGVATPSVTDILSAISSDGYANINPSVLEYARNRGKTVHELTEEIDYGVSPMILPEYQGYIRSYLTFLNEWKPEWDGIEAISYDEKRNVCGTIDRYGTIDGKKCVVDLKVKKTPSKRNYICDCCQTAEYAEMRSIEGAKRYTLYLTENGYRMMDCNKFENENGFSGIGLFDRLLETRLDIERILNNGKRTYRI